MNDPTDIRGWQRFDARTTTSGKLLESDVARLAGIGVRHVINLAPDDGPEALPGESEKLATAGIGYTYIPVPFDAPTDQHFEAFRAELAKIGDTPLHVHCIANYRVSAFYYRLNRDHRGMPEPEARALMHQQWAPEKSDDPRAKVWADFIK